MRARKVDSNAPKLRTMCRAVGISWLPLVPETGGEPDALVGWRGLDQLIEIKDPNGSGADLLPRPNQVEWHRHWHGRPVAVVYCFDDIRGLFE